MLYQELGGSKLKVSVITLGTWAIGGQHWGKYDQSAAQHAIETALANGINMIDTAPAYGEGHAEELLGQIIKNKREQVILATKCGIDLRKGFRIDLSPAFITLDLENSLRRLQTEYIDLYQCHWPDPQTPLPETLETLLRFQEQGKIKHLGVCNFRDNELREATRYAKIVSYQPQYSLLDREIEVKLQATCSAKNIGIIPYGVLGGGILTGKYLSPPQFESDDARSMFYDYYSPKKWPAVNALVDVLRQLAAKHQATPGQIAIAWVLAQKGVAAAIVGAKNAAQVSNNIRAAELQLNDQELSELAKASQNLQQAHE